MANKGKNKTKMRPGRRKIKSAGFKKKKVISNRRKMRKGSGLCKLHEEGWLPGHVVKRHTGRNIRKLKRMAEHPQPLKAV